MRVTVLRGVSFLETKQPCDLILSSEGFTSMWSMACSRASFGAITLLNLSSVVVKSLAYNCCNSTVIVMYEGTTYLLSSSGRPFSEGVRPITASKITDEEPVTFPSEQAVLAR
jgi:hypothetical protein